MKKLTAFDVDGTLTYVDSFMLFLRFYAGRGKFFLNIIIMLPIFALYGLRIISRDTTKNHLLRVFFKGHDYNAYLEKCRLFAKTAYALIAREDGIAAVKNHLKIGDEVAMVSASLYDYLVIWARDIGIKYVLATGLEVENGKLTGRMSGKNCRGQEKLNNIRANFPDYELVAAYGDSDGDKEMLNAADAPFYRKLIAEPRNAKALRNQLYFGTLLEEKSELLQK